MNALKIIVMIIIGAFVYFTISYIKKHGIIDILAFGFIAVSLLLLFALYNNVKTGVIQ